MLVPVILCLTLLFKITVAISIRRPTTGCGSPSPWTFDDNGHADITIGGRSFLVHIPQDYDRSTPHAVVLSFHGYGGNPAHQELITGFSESGVLLNNNSIIAVYPLGAYGPGRDNNSIAEPAWEGAPYAQYQVNDIAFTRSILKHVSANLCADSNRFYASGKSNGGGFTNLLACTRSTAALFAAFAPVSAALYPGEHPLVGCNPGRPVPVINFHGLADKVIPFNGHTADREGNTSYALPNITIYRQDWALRDGCRTVKATRVTKPFVNTTLHEWDCCTLDSRAVVKGYTVAGLGHSWPSTLGLDGGGNLTFNATTAAILPFFDSHYLTRSYDL